MDRLALVSPDDAVGGMLVRPDAHPRSLVACIHGGGCHSGYFESGKASLVGTFLGAGHQVLLVDRPGTRGGPLLGPEGPSSHRWTRSRPLSRRSGGFTVPTRPSRWSATRLAARWHCGLPHARRAGRWPLAAVLVFGIGGEPPLLVVAWPMGRGDALSTEAAGFFLGPEGTYNWRGLTRLREVAAPWNVAERMEMVRGWPALWQDLAPHVAVPVQIRLADGERIWMTSENVVRA